MSAQGKCLIEPGVFDGISTHLASNIGFGFLYLASSGASGSFTGEPDLPHTDPPIITDADMGFGGPLDIARTVKLYEHAGVAGCYIEDQVFSKRCRQYILIFERIRSAVEARVDPDFAIMARTDARQAILWCVKRLKETLEAGADMTFMESPGLPTKPVVINVLSHHRDHRSIINDYKTLRKKELAQLIVIPAVTLNWN
ncbi:Phosphoenolpyruvate/pyruvate domain-containing protein [Glonium stellatum]|uniref:Phosphoenolpyruvate/pyruvate domain-containing protein n=1 Tax=Glonium stellatum TaxID=574774 RepID=A0A8E2F1L6_9PEZI|nr:Phosphoenolpyruvate/pyruvate domain-containing protein [Glonium stellatum]